MLRVVYTLNVLYRTRVSKKEETALTSYLECSSTEKWIESSYEAEGPLYWITMSILVHSAERWSINRLSHLRRLIVLAHARHCSPTSLAKSFSDKTVKDYSVYKPYLNFFGLINDIYNYFFKVDIELILCRKLFCILFIIAECKWKWWTVAK